MRLGNLLNLLSLFCFLTIKLYSQNVVSPSNLNQLPVITVVYPWEGKYLGNVDKSFVFGNVKPYISTIIVNDVPVNVYKNGTFIAYVKLSSPRFNIVARNDFGISTFTRNVVLYSSDEINKENPFILISPSTYTEISKNNYIDFSIKGFRSSKIYYELGDICSGEVKEVFSDPGIYRFRCYIKENTKTKYYSLYLKYIGGKNDKKKFNNLIRVVDGSFIIKSSTDNVVLKNDAGGYIIFLPENVLMVSDMKMGNRYRVKLGDMNEWVDSDKVEFKGFVPYPFYTESGSVRFTKITTDIVNAKITLYQKVPFSVFEDDNKLYLTLYYTNLRTNWVIYDSSDTFIKNVVFKQEGFNKTVFVFNFNNKLWGYDISYLPDNSLSIDFKSKPYIIASSTQPLKGLRVILDPGHSPKKDPPYDGSVGPSGSYEWQINLDIALKLKKILEEKGADVVMTRYTNDESEQVPLQERSRFVKKIGGDIYISIHNNAIADGEDPYSKARGFQIYYYHLHSYDLAKEIHKSFVKNINLPDEGLRFGDYHVARITSMPSILIENAYMILPEHEEMLLDHNFQNKIADAIYKGILNFLYYGNK